MPVPLILASGSEIRAQLLSNAGLSFITDVARIDETSIRDAMSVAAAPPRDIADKLAELKAARISTRHPGALTIGCDQLLVHDGQIMGKPETADHAIAQLQALAAQQHHLITAAVITVDGTPQWRHIGIVKMTMRPLSSGYITDYVARSWHSIRHSVGAYQIEREGIRLFSRIDGDYFHILGLPLLELLSYLTDRGTISI